MEREVISIQVEEFVVEELMVKDKGSRIDHNISLIQDGIIDSLGILRLITFIKEKFGIDVGDDELVIGNFETVNEITEFIHERL